MSPEQSNSGSPFEYVRREDSNLNGLDEEHYIDNDMDKNGQSIPIQKVLPSMNEDENPFSLRLSKEQEAKEVEQVVAARKSKLSMVQKKSKSLLSQLNKFKQDTLDSLN